MKYIVTYYYHTNYSVVVDAESEDEAIQKGYNEDASGQLLRNLEEDSAPDATEIDTKPWNGQIEFCDSDEMFERANAISNSADVSLSIEHELIVIRQACMNFISGMLSNEMLSNGRNSLPCHVYLDEDMACGLPDCQRRVATSVCSSQDGVLYVYGDNVDEVLDDLDTSIFIEIVNQLEHK